MLNIRIVALSFACLIALLATAGSAADSTRRPNVIVIITDFFRVII